jgi:hypothetical protein
MLSAEKPELMNAGQSGEERPIWGKFSAGNNQTLRCSGAPVKNIEQTGVLTLRFSLRLCALAGKYFCMKSFLTQRRKDAKLRQVCETVRGGSFLFRFALNALLAIY